MTKIDTSTKTVKALLKDVTPGPWEDYNCPGDWGLGGTVYVLKCGATDIYDPTNQIALVQYQTPYCLGESRGVIDAAEEAVANAQFIAAARELVPALLAERDALKAEVATCVKYRDAYAECDRIGTQAVRDLEAKLTKAVEALETIVDNGGAGSYHLSRTILAELNYDERS